MQTRKRAQIVKLYKVTGILTTIMSLIVATHAPICSYFLAPM